MCIMNLALLRIRDKMKAVKGNEGLRKTLYNAMKGTHPKKKFDHREPLFDERRQRTFLGHHPGASF